MQVVISGDHASLQATLHDNTAGSILHSDTAAHYIDRRYMRPGSSKLQAKLKELREY